MGVIKDGTVSGCLPDTKVFAVHYPGYPSSSSRAIDTLGGVDKIEKVRTSKSHKLELYFRPEDPYSHPTSGQLYPSKNLLLKISKKNDNDCANDANQKNSATSQSTSAGIQSDSTEPAVDQIPDSMSSHLSADIVAHVEEEYHFNGMADYQHVLAEHADMARKRQRTWTEFGSSNETGASAYVDENLMILAPPLFSIKDVPENVLLSQSVTQSSKKKLEGVVRHRWEMEIEPGHQIDFNIKAEKVNWEAHIPEASDEWYHQVAVSKLFDERPIWTRASISERVGTMGLRKEKIGEMMLKRLLFRVAYYFGSGPFHRFWIRRGYDPRKDPESRIYQRIDFRIPQDLRIHCDTSKGTKQSWEDICSFQVFPFKFQTYLQLCELSDDYIQQEIRKPAILSTCTPETGWFSARALNTLRLHIALRFLSICTLAGADETRRSISDRYERSKRMRVQPPTIRPCDGASQVNEETGAKEKEAPDEDDEEENEVEETGAEEEKEAPDEDDEEENEVEDDEAEEGMYAYDRQLDAEDAHFPMQTDPYEGEENLSRNYLLELFGSFPLAGDGVGFQNPESDEEYHIYEPDKDSSDDDDY